MALPAWHELRHFSKSIMFLCANTQRKLENKNSLLFLTVLFSLQTFVPFTGTHTLPNKYIHLQPHLTSAEPYCIKPTEDIPWFSSSKTHKSACTGATTLAPHVLTATGATSAALSSFPARAPGPTALPPPPRPRWESSPWGRSRREPPSSWWSPAAAGRSAGSALLRTARQGKQPKLFWKQNPGAPAPHVLLTAVQEPRGHFSSSGIKSHR